MNFEMRAEMAWLLAGVGAVLVIGSLAGFVLSRRAKSPAAKETVANLNARVKAWWVMVAVLALAFVTGEPGTIALYGLISFLALREFMTLAPTDPSDHRALLAVFFIAAPAQYFFIAIDWYGMFSIMIPVYAFFAIPAINALRGESARFLERTAIIQWGLLICVYNISHAPALLLLDIEDFADRNTQLLIFFVIVVQASDVLQYVWGKTLGRHKIAPVISPNKTWEGFVGGVASATALGAVLWWATPFAPWQAALMALVICLAGFFGGLIMSAIKRDRGAKDYGSFIKGHGGVLDRVDSISFAAPLFFHLTRYYWGA